MPLVSVVLSVYNGADYVDQCIRSVLDQSYQNLELIVVNDGSTDTTPEIVASFTDPRIRFSTNPVRRHMCYAMNLGLAQAKGSWVAHIDHDDLWTPDKLEKQMAYVTAHPEVGACFTFADIIGPDGHTIPGPPQIQTFFHTTCSDQRSWARQLFYQGNTLCHSSALVRRDLAGSYNLFLRQLQDYDFWCQLVGKTQFHVLPEELVHYRWEERPEKGSASTFENMMRTYNEYVIAKERLLSRLSDGQLVAWFGSDFRCPDAATPLELRIERAFLLCACGQTDSPVTAPGLEALERLLREPGCLEVLEQRYHFTLFDLYDLTAGGAFYQPILMERLRSGHEAEVRSQSQEAQLAQTQKRLGQLEGQLRQAEDRTRQLEERCRQAEDRTRQLEERCRQAEERGRKLADQLEQTRSACAALEQQRDQYRSGLEQVLDSTCWKLTAPLRALRRGQKEK